MASASPMAAARLSAKIETSVANVTTRSTASAPITAMAPMATGNAAARSPPNTHTRTRKLSGMASDSISSRSRWDCSVICTLTIAVPPVRTVTPSRSPLTCSEMSSA